MWVCGPYGSQASRDFCVFPYHQVGLGERAAAGQGTHSPQLIPFCLAWPHHRPGLESSVCSVVKHGFIFQVPCNVHQPPTLSFEMEVVSWPLSWESSPDALAWSSKALLLEEELVHGPGVVQWCTPRSPFEEWRTTLHSCWESPDGTPLAVNPLGDFPRLKRASWPYQGQTAFSDHWRWGTEAQSPTLNMLPQCQTSWWGCLWSMIIFSLCQSHLLPFPSSNADPKITTNWPPTGQSPQLRFQGNLTFPTPCTWASRALVMKRKASLIWFHVFWATWILLQGSGHLLSKYFLKWEWVLQLHICKRR